MVDYQGPALFRQLVESMEIPIFDRISKLRYNIQELDYVVLDKTDVAQMQKLEEIVVTKSDPQQVVSEAEISKIKQAVPSCRLASVDIDSKNVRVQVDSSFLSLSCSGQ